MVDSIQRVLAWGWACAHCGVAWKGELRDPCPECGAFGKRAVYDNELLAECDVCGRDYIDRSDCPSCVRRRAGQLANVLNARFDLDWERLFNELPGFVGWSAALQRAKALAQTQRIAVLAAAENAGVS